ncbi:MAG: peptide MFS transporter [Verrucomicrobia bacterium]|nr:peptide MFS transporter [Verrucomicrobiota bacterium]
MNPSSKVAGTIAAGAEPARHPRGLYTLFFTEMWERFSYYGMRALLVLFMVDAVGKGGMGLDDKVATSIYGLYTAGVYLAALPGGWVADRLLGAQRSIWYGGLLIAAGHFTLAIPRVEAFYLGLMLLVIGTGLLKPNISAIVGELYPEGGARRDAGFTIFYMGINLGAAIGPLICSTLGEKINWHYGFAAAGVGMVLGLIQYRLTARHLGEAGLRPGNQRALSRVNRLAFGGAMAALVLAVGLGLTGRLRINPVWLAQRTTTVIVSVAVLYFVAVLGLGKLESAEKKRVIVIFLLFVSAAIFWAGFEQAGSSLNLFAERHTERTIGRLHYEVPAGWLQSLNPLFIITLAPVVAATWVRLARRRLNPSVPVKFGLGLVLLALGFLVMSGAALRVVAGHKAWPTWLMSTYLLHTIGELCLSPVGLSSVTKLAPRRLVGQMMGTWFLGASLGNLIAGLVAGEFKPDTLDQMPTQFLQIVWMPLAAGVLLIVLARPIKKLMAGVE